MVAAAELKYREQIEATGHHPFRIYDDDSKLVVAKPHELVAALCTGNVVRVTCRFIELFPQLASQPTRLVRIKRRLENGEFFGRFENPPYSGQYNKHCVVFPAESVSSIPFYRAGNETIEQFNPDPNYKLDTPLHYSEQCRQRHSRICDFCRVHPIQGIRYVCINCCDYDVCSKCLPQWEKHHPGHKLMPVFRGNIRAADQPPEEDDGAGDDNDTEYDDTDNDTDADR